MSSAKKMSDILFGTIESFHGARPWGRFLDAGTGVHSIKWVQSLPTSSWTAITADNAMKNSMLSDASVSRNLRPVDEVLVGNWMNDKFVHSLGQYDTILADYLIGAVDGFSPYEQDVIIHRLKEHLTPNGRLYFIGMNPIPDEITPPGNIISEIRRARDACILLAGHRPYREFPVSWMKRHIEAAGMKVTDSSNFTIMHTEESAMRQVRVAKSKFDLFRDANLRRGMDEYLLDLEKRLKVVVKEAGGRIPMSFDYVMAVELSDPSNVAGRATISAEAAAAGAVAETDNDHQHQHSHHTTKAEDV